MTINKVQDHITSMKKRLASTTDFAEGLSFMTKNDMALVSNAIYPRTNARIDLKKNTVIASSGSRKEMGRLDLNEMLNFPQGEFLRDTKYIVDDVFEFMTDSSGRVRHARASLNDGISIRHGSRPSYTSDKDMEEGDEHGHLIAASLMAPHESINLAGMLWETNNEMMRHLESFLSFPIRLGIRYELELSVGVIYPNLIVTRPGTIRYSAQLKSSYATGQFSFELSNNKE